MTGLQNSDKRERSYLGLVLILAAIYTGVFSYLSIRRYDSFNSGMFDMGIMLQTFWNTAQGRLMEESVNMGQPTSRLWAAHWELIYVPLALFYRIFPSPHTPLVLQALFVAAGAIPVFWFAREYLKNHFAALAFALAYLLYPAMHNAVLYDVHGVTFATAPLLFAMWYLHRGQALAFGISAFVALLCREDSGVLLFMIGLYALFFMKERRALGVAICLVGLAWFASYKFGGVWLKEALGVAEEVQDVGAGRGHWAWLEGGRVIWQRPQYFFGEMLLTKMNLRYLLDVLGPLGFLSCLAPLALGIAAPMFGLNMLSDWVPPHTINYQYTATITPFVFVSAILGLRALSSFLQAHKPDFAGAGLYRAAAVGVVLLSVAFCVKRSQARNAHEWQRTERHEMIDRVIASIPASASLTTDLVLGARATERRELYVFPENLRDVDYVLYDFYAPEYRFMSRSDYFLPVVHPLNDSIGFVLSAGDFACVKYGDGIALFQSNADRVGGGDILAFADENEIRTPARIAVDSLIFRGYSRQRDAEIFEKRVLRVTTFWQRTGSLTGKRFVYRISNGAASFEFKHAPVFGLYAPEEWPASQLIRDEIFWDVPENLPKGEYEMAVALDDKSSARHWVPLAKLELGN